MNINELEKKLRVEFANKKLYEQAFTHSSYVNEHRKHLVDNERLEFLGDAVLELGVSQYLYRKHPSMVEGEMTKLRATIVCEASLAHFAEQLELGDYLRLGKGEEQTGGRMRPSILADVFESFLGAFFLDQGYDRTVQFLEQHVYPKIISGAFSHAMDYKSELQELVQQNKGIAIRYDIIEERGPSHNKEFVAQVTIDQETFSEGIGKTKKEAEQRAAKKALDVFNK
ncbi:MAG TPA: ribonuclease III [Bacillota bacterium]|nr:ribonuclease III [Bacillota bacterium]